MVLLLGCVVVLSYLSLPIKIFQKIEFPAVMFQNNGEHVEITSLVIEGEWSHKKISQSEEQFNGIISTEALYYTEEKGTKIEVKLKKFEESFFMIGMANYFGKNGRTATLTISTNENHDAFILQGKTVAGREGECIVIAPAKSVEEAYLIWKELGYAEYPDTNHDTTLVRINGEIYKKCDAFSFFEDRVNILGTIKSFNKDYPIMDNQSNMEALIGAQYGYYENQLYVHYLDRWYHFRRIYDDMAAFKAQGKVYHCTGVFGVVDEVVILGNIETCNDNAEEYPVEDNQCNEPDWVGASYGINKGKMYLYYCGEWLRCYEVKTE